MSYYLITPQPGGRRDKSQLTGEQMFNALIALKEGKKFDGRKIKKIIRKGSDIIVKHKKK